MDADTAQAAAGCEVDVAKLAALVGVAPAAIKAVSVEAVVTRGPSGVHGPPGSTEDLGVVAEWAAN